MLIPAASTPAESLPDFTGIDLAQLRDRTDHPVLDAVLDGLLRHPRSVEDTFAYFNDGGTSLAER